MRNLVWIGLAAAVTLAAPVASAQPQPPANTAPAQQQSYTPGPPNPGNCGTPDEPKACGPMPRTPLKHYRPKPKPAAKPPAG